MIDKAKTYHTRRGHPVTILRTDGLTSRPVEGVILISGKKIKYQWTSRGKRLLSGEVSSLDLIEAV